jgi:hypothetical protein
MNIGLLLPVKKKWWRPVSLKTYKVEVSDSLSFVVCLFPCNHIKDFFHLGNIKRSKARVDRLFEKHSAWPVLEHPELFGLYQNDLSFTQIVIRKIVVNRFYEVLKSLRGLGHLSNMEILITGLPCYLEHAIEKLITKVKTINILIPEGMEEPVEAERAFWETGIPVHITNDKDILKRNRVWLRFPRDHHSFDDLPQEYKGTIVDFEELKIIDTRIEKIYNINIEFSEVIRRKLGQKLLRTWKKGELEGFVIATYACFYDINEIEASIRLGTRITFAS